MSLWLGVCLYVFWPVAKCVHVHVCLHVYPHVCCSHRPFLLLHPFKYPQQASSGGCVKLVGSNITFSGIEFQKNKCVPLGVLACMYECISICGYVSIYTHTSMCHTHFLSLVFLQQVQEHGRGVRRLPLQYHHRRVREMKQACRHDDMGRHKLSPLICSLSSHDAYTLAFQSPTTTAASSVATTP